MVKIPVAERRGCVTDFDGGSTQLCIDATPDEILDKLLAAGVIGAARRDCTAALLAGEVPRPVGSWGAIIRLKGQPWTYVCGDDLRIEWSHEWAKQHGWRVAFFQMDGMLSRRRVWVRDGDEEVVTYDGGIAVEAEPGDAFMEDDEGEGHRLRGKLDVCNEAWLRRHETNIEVYDALARELDAYLPLYLGHSSDDEGKASIFGVDGDPHAGDNDGPYVPFEDEDYERIDLFTFGGPETLEPSDAQKQLGEAVRAGDVEGVRTALAAGAEPGLMHDDDDTPLEIALRLQSAGTMYHWVYELIGREQQYAIVELLLEAGAKVYVKGRNPTVAHWIQKSAGLDAPTVLRVLRLLLAHGADATTASDDPLAFHKTPIQLACDKHEGVTVAALLAAGADASGTNREGRTLAEQARINEASSRSGGTIYDFYEAERLKSVAEALEQFTETPPTADQLDAMAAEAFVEWDKRHQASVKKAKQGRVAIWGTETPESFT